METGRRSGARKLSTPRKKKKKKPSNYPLPHKKIININGLKMPKRLVWRL